MTATVFVDYADGSRGEILAYFLNSHREFDNQEFLDQTMQELDGCDTKWFNAQSLVHKDWNLNFYHYLQTWQNQSSRAKVLSYHLYKYPAHVDLLKTHVPDVRFVKINSQGYENFYKYDYIRKILFRKLTKKNLQEIKFLISDQQKITIIQLLKQDQLRGIDMVLANHNQPINSRSRREFIRDFLARNFVLPSQDLEINYHDWFLDSKSLPGCYEKLCHELKICPDQNRLDKLLERNKKNFAELLEFRKNFDQLMETL